MNSTVRAEIYVNICTEVPAGVGRIFGVWDQGKIPQDLQQFHTTKHLMLLGWVSDGNFDGISVFFSKCI